MADRLWPDRQYRWGYPRLYSGFKPEDGPRDHEWRRPFFAVYPRL